MDVTSGTIVTKYGCDQGTVVPVAERIGWHELLFTWLSVDTVTFDTIAFDTITIDTILLTLSLFD